MAISQVLLLEKMRITHSHPQIKSTFLHCMIGYTRLFCGSARQNTVRLPAIYSMQLTG